MSRSNGVVAMPERTEAERQALIAELRTLREAGVNVVRQKAIEHVLRTEFELGWPAESTGRRRDG